MHNFDVKPEPEISLLKIRELSDEMKSIGDDSSQANTLADRAKNSAEQGVQALSNVNATLNAFVDSSGQINALLEDINSLTQQVHILGVNAAIEAASAGRHSGGFSIIAEEMRHIAARVKGTSESIYEILQDSGALADDTVNVITAASETLELLEVSADLSLELTQAVSEKARRRADELEGFLQAPRSPGDDRSG